MTLPRSLALLLPLVLLAGCSKGTTNDKRSASGEVLQGSTSDAMLPLDKLKSQPPLLAPSEEKSTPEGKADRNAGKAEDATSADSSDETSADETTPAPQASSAAP